VCGIVGIHSLDGERPIDLALLQAMNDSLTHRGPDSAGHFHEPGRVGLAMRRLSIIDVAGGAQPIANEDRSVWIVFNGEIYNFAELRERLEGLGHRFESHSDTEVIVHAYEEYGDDCVTHLRGMFAFAIWDSRRQRLLIARDRVGIKQLFFTQAGGQLLWGSEIKALLQHPAVPRRMRPAAVNHFLTFLYVPEPLSMFEGIEELRAGHLLVAEAGKITVRPYWRLRYEVDEGMNLETATAGLRERLEEAVRIRLISEVPLGGFLSGGIDSGAVVALMARHSNAAVNTFSIGYSTGGAAFDERVYARELATRYGTRHREFEMTPDLVEIAPRLVQAFDQPSADSTAIPTWYLCEQTRQHVTVALSGLGGDEVAAGYERYRGALLAERLGWVPAWLRRGLLRPLVDLLPDPRSGHPFAQRAKRFVRAMDLPFDQRYFEFVSQMSREARADLLAPEILEQIDLDDPYSHYQACIDEVRDAAPLHRALFADLKLYLPGDLLTLTDRISMAHSLEVRVPFLDHHLLEFAARIPPRHKLAGTQLKHVLREAVRDLLPADFFRRRKMGFAAPLGVWFRENLREFVEDTLSRDAISRTGTFRYPAIRRILDDHYTRRANYDNQIWALISFTLWHQGYITGRPDALRP
jgi:asparagine synthase (glutamine-hydrolysing)